MELKNALKKICNELETILFPQCCLKCGKISNNILCNNCKKEIYKNVNIKVIKKERNLNKEIYFDEHIYLFEYKDIIRKLILEYKFKDKSYLYNIFSKIIIKNKKICGILEKYDIIMPVPIHKKRKSVRGYNQSELITRDICIYIQNIKHENKLLVKTKYNVEQSSLSKEKRKENVKNVYKLISKEKIKNKKIVVFDDIYTTGNTVNEISKLLKENGAKKVLILTIAKD